MTTYQLALLRTKIKLITHISYHCHQEIRYLHEDSAINSMLSGLQTSPSANSLPVCFIIYGTG